LAKKSGEKFVIAGTGNPLRQFIYSEDLAKLILWVLFDYNEIDPIILSVNESNEISIKNVVEIISNEFDYKNIEWDNSKPDGQFKKTADNTKLSSLNNFEFTNINHGLKQTIQWFIQNYDIARK
jgi:GDP-L-fucose synthase